MVMKHGAEEISGSTWYVKARLHVDSMNGQADRMLVPGSSGGKSGHDGEEDRSCTGSDKEATIIPSALPDTARRAVTGGHSSAGAKGTKNGARPWLFK
jgi:hypothetical protein